MTSSAYRENDLFYTDKPSKADVQCDCGQDFPLSSSLAFPSRNLFFLPLETVYIGKKRQILYQLSRGCS